MPRDPLPFRRIAKACALGLLLAFSPLAARADFLREMHQALSLHDSQKRFQLQLSGLVDAETYFLDQPAPALLFTEHNFLFNPRLTLFLDAQIGSKVYLFLQARADRGFDPSDDDAQIRADEYFLRYSFSKAINVQIGQFATVVGNWVARHDSWQNPFINAPLPYEHLTGIWDGDAPDEPDELLEWGHVGEYDTADYSDKYFRLPIIWGPSYASGLSVFGSLGKFDYAAEMKNSSLASRPESWSATEVGFNHPTFSGRIGLRPNEMWNVGISASGGPYLLAAAGPDLPRGRGIGDYREFVLAQDISFAWHRLQIWAECYETRFQVPRLGNADVLAYYLEARYQIAPQIFAALRWNQEFFGTIRDEEERAQWGNNVWRIDAAIAYRFTNYVQAKLQYSFTDEEATPYEGQQILATQLTLKF